MKLRTIELAGFRGAPVPIEIRLGEQSLCLLAENGHGKSTFVDALEFWSTGDVEHYHGDGYRLDSVVNLDAAVATVTCECTGHPPLRRDLTGGNAGQLIPIRPRPVDAKDPQPIPILRHRAMARFMSMTAGEKKAVLLELFDLAALTDFRSTLRTAVNDAEGRCESARRALRTETAALDVLLDGRGVVELAETLRASADIEGSIVSERDLLGLEVSDADRPAQPDRVGLVQSAARAMEGARDDNDAVSSWNEAVANRVLVVEEGLLELLRSGERVLQDWSEDLCPLCLQDKDHASLLSETVQRAERIASSERTVFESRQRVRGLIDRQRRLAQSIRGLIDGAPEGGWQESEKLAAAVDATTESVAELERCLANYARIDALPTVDLPEMTELEAIAREGAANDKAARVAEFVRLRETVSRARSAEVLVWAAADGESAVRKLLEITDRRTREAIEGELARIGGLAARYYGMLISNPVYSDVTVNYVDRRAGGVEFSLVYDGRHRVSPPQRILSESQLNALGLALFLARLKDANGEWKTVVLDDVVNSFDMNHRQALAQLLRGEFGDWQVICVTHDRVFVDVARRALGPGWRYQQVVAWSPAGGPILQDGDPLEQLRAKLAEGRAAVELGALGRVALEQGLSKPLAALGLAVRYDPHHRHAAHELLTSLRRGLRDRGSALADAPVLGRIEADGYLMNLGSHDRPADPALTTADLQRLVSDLEELWLLWICTACQDAVWTATRNGGSHHQCTCGAHAV